LLNVNGLKNILPKNIRLLFYNYCVHISILFAAPDSFCTFLKCFWYLPIVATILNSLVYNQAQNDYFMGNKKINSGIILAFKYRQTTYCRIFFCNDFSTAKSPFLQTIYAKLRPGPTQKGYRLLTGIKCKL